MESIGINNMIDILSGNGYYGTGYHINVKLKQKEVEEILTRYGIIDKKGKLVIK